MPKLTNAFATTHDLDMRTEIRRERTIELFNEGFRIDDLKRWKTAETEMPQDFLGIRWTGTEFQNNGRALPMKETATVSSSWSQDVNGKISTIFTHYLPTSCS